MSQLFISRMPKMRAIPQLVSAPLNPIPIAEHNKNVLSVSSLTCVMSQLAIMYKNLSFF